LTVLGYRKLFHWQGAGKTSHIHQGGAAVRNDKDTHEDGGKAGWIRANAKGKFQGGGLLAARVTESQMNFPGHAATVRKMIRELGRSGHRGRITSPRRSFHDIDITNRQRPFVGPSRRYRWRTSIGSS